MAKIMEVNGLDFLIMAQNGILKVKTNETGEITGIELPDEMIEEYDGLVVAIHELPKAMSEIRYKVLKLDPKPVEVEQVIEG